MFSPPPADFIGQATADRYLTIIVISFGALSLTGGYLLQSVAMIFKIFSVGVLLASVAIIPPWPYQRQNPIKFAPEPASVNDKSDPVNDNTEPAVVKEKSSSNSSKKSKKSN